MMEYIIVQQGSTEFLICKQNGNGDLYSVMAKCSHRGEAEAIVAALSRPVELRRSWVDG